MDTTQLLKRLYPNAVKRPWRAVKLVRRVGRWVRNNMVTLVLGVGLIGLWIVGHLYYYNKLIDLEYNIQEAWAQVETQWQRRYHIQQNVTLLVTQYARHERDLMTSLTAMREHLARTAEQKRARAEDSAQGADNAEQGAANAERRADTAAQGANASRGATTAQGAAAHSAPETPPVSLAKERGTQDLSPDAPPAGQSLAGHIAALLDETSPSELNRLFPQIRLVAEQYPQLRASENFQQFTQSIIETETKIANQVMEYNKAVNDYTTVLQQFPANIFGKLCGFELYQFYAPEKQSLQFRTLTAGS